MKKHLALISILASFLLTGCGGEKPNPDPGPDPEPIPPTPVVVNPTSITLNTTSISLVEGGTSTLTATVMPENATDKTVTWSVSEGSDYVSVANGVVTALKAGNAVVTAKTVNDLTASCSVSVTAAIILPSSVSFDEAVVNLTVGDTKTLTATVLPSNAKDKTVTYSILSGGDVISINPSTGVVTADHEGTAKVQVTTVNGKTDTCTVVVGTRYIKGYINEDRHSLIDGNPYEKVNGGDFVEVTRKTIVEGVPCYDFTYGATVKFNVKTVGYYEPTEIKVNGVPYSVVDSAVTFPATVEDPDDPIFNFLDLEVVFKDNTPLIGDYSIETTEPTHISIVYKYDVNGQETKACSQGDKIIVVPHPTDPDYEVKTITGYTYTTNDTIKHKTYFDINKVGDGTFYFITPFSHEEVKTIWIEVTEVNSSLFKNSDLVGSYAVVRTYGLSGSDLYITQFESNSLLAFASSGEITYKEEVAYASSAKDGAISAMAGTSSFTAYYSKNLIVLGQPGSGSNFITPLSQGSTDLVIAVKMMDGMLLKDVTLDNFVFKVDGNVYGVFTFYYANALYASCFVDISTSTITTGISVKQYLGEKLHLDKTVFEVFDKDNNSLLHVGYNGDGGTDEYRLITTRLNGYTNLDHTLVFHNNDNALLDGNSYSVIGSGSSITLASATHEYDITLDDSLMTFVITADRAVQPKTLDIANKVFVGKSGKDWEDYTYDITITFGPSNDNITGVLLMKDNVKRYWAFDAEFDASTNILLITVTDRGYGGQTSNIDSSIGKQARIKVEDGKLTILDHISTQSNVYNFKNCVVTCDDFHF